MAPLVSTTAALPQTIADDRAAALHTKAVYLVFTSLLETPPAAGVAIELAHALGVPLIVVEFRAGRLPAQPDDATEQLTVDSGAFDAWLHDKGISARTRVVMCRSVRDAIATTFRRHSLIVLGGSRRWWPTRAQRFRRALESAGHFVFVVRGDVHAA